MYKGHAVYRFLDRDQKNIYVGKTTNAYRRLMNQHFKNNGHLKNYDDVARVDIIKLDNNKDCVELEQYLIDKYKPRLNKADKSHSPFRQYPDDPRLDNMEKWKEYRKLKDFNYKIEKDKNDHILVVLYIAILIGAFLFSVSR